MATILQDPTTRLLNLRSPRVGSQAPLAEPPGEPNQHPGWSEGRRQVSSEYRFEREGPEASFELEPLGGEARTVIGTFAHFDAQTQTYFVREHDGGLGRVPLRDVKATHVASVGRSGAHSSCLGSDADEIVRTFVGDR